jgi:hypothetical protein
MKNDLLLNKYIPVNIDQLTDLLDKLEYSLIFNKEEVHEVARVKTRLLINIDNMDKNFILPSNNSEQLEDINKMNFNIIKLLESMTKSIKIINKDIEKIIKDSKQDQNKCKNMPN